MCCIESNHIPIEEGFLASKVTILDQANGMNPINESFMDENWIQNGIQSNQGFQRFFNLAVQPSVKSKSPSICLLNASQIFN